MKDLEKNKIKKRFEALILDAIEIAKKESARLEKENASSALKEVSRLTVENLKNILIGVMSERMLPSNGALLGLTRNIGEWTENEELMELAYQLDKLYSESL